MLYLLTYVNYILFVWSLYHGTTLEFVITYLNVKACLVSCMHLSQTRWMQFSLFGCLARSLLVHTNLKTPLSHALKELSIWPFFLGQALGKERTHVRCQRCHIRDLLTSLQLFKLHIILSNPYNYTSIRNNLYTKYVRVESFRSRARFRVSSPLTSQFRTDFYPLLNFSNPSHSLDV